jgi:hypothetical protein
MSGYVYAMRSGSAIKIGFSTEPERRLLSIATGCADGCELVGYAVGTKEHEAELHALCSKEHIRGEWFREEGVVSLFLEHLPKNGRSSKSGKRFNEVAHVIDMVGGTAAMAQLCGVAPKTIHQWKFRKRLPQDKFLIISKALSAKGKKADLALWRFIPAKDATQ